ncbi:hypothetical protein EDF81_1787 [Enterobacter sp. BIGb0383]|uniref:hypothetical protein n=1 Tax=unclassified Enterobacter TaxID=2608935 RepID=UPI000F49CC4C|nr:MULTISPECIES: hypothetical protein [unclassified Enterobacter]ROP59004.1 hypothetical protein EDF81_1787 [Enterobacter sp. BIGb0383]ROS09530.1 hypothetical protein EC848_3054 [Enterobacter sp. BIGb0359]
MENNFPVTGVDGNFADFLRELLDFESGLSVNNIELFRSGYNNPEAVNYVVTHIREADGVRYPTWTGGVLQYKKMSYKEYFTVLGVDDIWSADEANGGATKETLLKMQFKSLNWLNFVGYQVGEAVLFEAGYYIPPAATTASGEKTYKYYVWTELSWADDQYEQEYLMDGATTPIIVTRANTWLGTFTGKHGVNSLEDLRTVDGQNFAIRDVMWHNVDTIYGLIDASTQSLSDVFKKSFPWSGGGESGTVDVTMSGILAAAHLSGAQGTTKLLLDGTITKDENGTSNTYYMNLFGGATTLMDTPAYDRIIGTTYPERLSCGMNGSDYVDTGANGGNIVEVNIRDTSRLIEMHGLNFSGQAGENDTIAVNGIDNNAVVTFEAIASDNQSTTVSVKANGAERSQWQLFGISESAFNTAVAQSNIVQERRWMLAWSGGVTAIDNFSIVKDRFYSATSHSFDNLLMNKATIDSSGGVTLDVIGADGGSYFGYLLKGYKASDFTDRNFINIIGSLSQMHSGYVFGWDNAPLGTLLTYFDVKVDKVYLGTLTGDHTFSEATYSANGNQTTFTFPSDGGGNKSIVFPNNSWEEIRNADAIVGLKGNINDVRAA